MKLEKVINREGDAGEFIKVDYGKCTSCGNCYKICPVGAWSKIYGKYGLDLTRCIECGACWFVCTPDAITFEYPKGGAGIRVRYG